MVKGYKLRLYFYFLIMVCIKLGGFSILQGWCSIGSSFTVPKQRPQRDNELVLANNRKRK